MCDERSKPQVGRRLIWTEMNVFNLTKNSVFPEPKPGIMGLNGRHCTLAR